METKKISAPLDAETARSLRAGDRVLLSGTVYTARDAAHKKLCELLASGGESPFDLKGAVIYYWGRGLAGRVGPGGGGGWARGERM